MTTQTPFVRIASACAGHFSMKVTSRPARTRSAHAGSVRARADDGDLLALHADAFPGAGGEAIPSACGSSEGLHVSIRSVSSLLKPGNPRRLADKHEEVAIAATVGERRLVLLADLGDQRHGAMVPPRHFRDEVEILHDLLEGKGGRIGPVHHGVALVLQQRRSDRALRR